jgi:fatty acid synthase subunit beta
LAGSELNWLFALISSPTVVQGTSYVDNALLVRRILVPRAGQKVVVKYAGSLPLSVTVYGAARSYGEHVPTFKALSIVFNPETKLIDLTLFEERQDVAIPLSLQFQYCPSQGFAPIHEIASGRNERIKQFYWKLWFGNNEVLPNFDIHESFVGPDAAINSSDVEQFCCGRKPWRILQGCKERQRPGAYGFCHRYLLEGNISGYSFSAYLILTFFRPSSNPLFQLISSLIYSN